MAPVSMVHIHHEGGGAPCTAAQCDRFGEGGYCYGIGTDTFRRWRSPAENWATADWNHRDLTLCFSGDRHTGYEVTDHDLIVLHNAFMDSYNRGEVTAAPSVVAHRNAGGSNRTACPGDRAMRRFNDIIIACRAANQPGPTPPQPKPPEDIAEMQTITTLNQDGRAESFMLLPNGAILSRWRNVSGGGWTEWSQFDAGPFTTISVWTNEKEESGKITKTLEVAGQHKTKGFIHKWQTAPNNGWSNWEPW